jgi:carotenoid cleavage dioxygenase-like enzyme
VTQEGELVHQIAFTASYYAMMHDFGITPDYAVFNLMPSIGSWERLEQGLPHFGFDTTSRSTWGFCLATRERPAPISAGSRVPTASTAT